MFGTYIGNEKMLVNPSYGGIMILPSTDLGLMPTLVGYGVHEEALTHFFINTIKPGDTVLDIGANYGYFTILAGMLSGPQGKVYAFEAAKKIYKSLVDNVNMNYINKQVRLYHNAIYSKEAELEFYVSERYDANSTLHKQADYEEKYQDTYTSEIVKAIPLGEGFAHLKTIKLVKMDIEGGEYHALLGMENLFEKGIVENFVFEWNLKPLGENVEAFVELLKKINQQYGYTLHMLDKNGNKQELYQLNYGNLKTVEFYPNFVFSK